MVRPTPDFSLESVLSSRGFTAVAGVDEAGRGPLAGPVFAGAVILDPSRMPEGLNDSKVLGIARRIALAEELASTAYVAVGVASVEEIDALNILRASHLAMVRALAELPRVDHALIDGNMVPRGLNLAATPVVKGDARSLSIAAASIVAKVGRDRVMDDLATQYPGYGWDTNRGYPSKAHLSALRHLGPTPHHRRSFKPVREML